MTTRNPTNADPTLGAHFIAGDTYNPMGAAPIPASPEAWAPYPLYTTELTPAISHTAFTYPAATAAAAALHAQVSLDGTSRIGEKEGSELARLYSHLVMDRPAPQSWHSTASCLTVPLGFGM